MMPPVAPPPSRPPPSPPPPSPSPPLPPQVPRALPRGACDDSCPNNLAGESRTHNGRCQDVSGGCPLGTDCSDCGVRAFAACRPGKGSQCFQIQLRNSVCED
eukprot:301009-Prymnesium_polylepis.1